MVMLKELANTPTRGRCNWGQWQEINVFCTDGGVPIGSNVS
jgi:hypothetical protein